MKNYYLKFAPAEKVNYLYLFALADVAQYRAETKAYDYIQYKSIQSLAETAGIPKATLDRILTSKQYSAFLTIDKKAKVIILHNSFPKGTTTQFVRLTDNEVQFLRLMNDTLLNRYFVYIKYYCGLAEYNNTKQDFTAKQFLQTCGLCYNSHSNIDRIRQYNRLLQDNGYIKIQQYRDEAGHTRNIYSLA